MGTRRFSLEDNFMKIKTLNDLIYGKLQSLSYLNQEKERFVYIKDFNQSKIAQELGIPIRTFKNNFKILQATNFVTKGTTIDLEGKLARCYYLPENRNEKYKLIPVITLDYLLTTNTKNVIKIYLYLLDKYDWKTQDYIFTKKELLEAIGYEYRTENLKIIDYILNDLILKKLIYINKIIINNKSYYKLIRVNTIIKGMEEETNKELQKEQAIISGFAREK